MHLIRLLIVFGAVLLAFAGYKVVGAPEAVGSLIVTSDTHISVPAGRWPWTTEQYGSFLQSLDNPEIVFLVGDFVDNVRNTEHGVTAGGLKHWKDEIDLYRRPQKALARSETKFLHSLGPGHDWIGEVTIEEAEKYAGVSRRGIDRWGRITLIWFTVYPAVFSNSGSNPSALRTEDYDWLDQQLENSDSAILLWHVPIRTSITSVDGVWPGESNLTIPTEDQLYPLIEKYSDRINLIFNGHIHKPSRSAYKGIPVYLCPFFRIGCYCELGQKNGQISVEPKQCNLSKEVYTIKSVDQTDRDI